MNPLNNPAIVYLRAMVAVRIDRARSQDRSLGVSAIEWAIITGMLALIAVAVFGVIRATIKDKADEISDHTNY
jgi:Flp pilus assembly pilin Flp